MSTKYEYVVAYQLSSVIHPAKTGNVQILATSDTGVSLSGNPDEALRHVDRDSAIRSLLLKSVFTPSEVRNLDDEISEIQNARNRMLGNAGCLVIRFSKPFDLDPSSRIEEDGSGSWRFGFDLLDKDAIRRERRRELSAILTGILVTVPGSSDAHKIADSVYILDDAGVPTYTTGKLKVSAALSVARVLSAEDLAKATSAVQTALRLEKFEQVQRLVVDALDPKLDRWRRFLFAWTGLEVLVNRLFKKSEDESFSSLSTVATPSGKLFLACIGKVVRKKYSLVDKFTILSLHMSPTTADADTTSFKKVKKVRDDFVHGDDVKESELPLEETRRILVSYMRLALKRPPLNGRS